MGSVTDGETGEEVQNAQDIIGNGQIEVDIFYGKDNGGMSKVVNKQIIITNVAERTSSFSNGPGKFYTISGKAKIGKVVKTIGFNTGSTVLMRELDDVKEYLPVKAKIREVKMSNGFRYFTMQDRNKKSDN
ncbi:unnamed protein product [marine sediment metagenome]|uniref:Uncharacterized protein n=1 Tax=marine sediment metagenome TaxID=412755 RepID=X1GV45_9ZZZZ